jgi:glucan-binding YG repeat protein
MVRLLKVKWFKGFTILILFILASTLGGVQSKANTNGSVFYNGESCEGCDSYLYSSNGITYQILTESNDEEETYSSLVNAINQSGQLLWSTPVPDDYSFFNTHAPAIDAKGNLIFTLYNHNWQNEEDGYYLASIDSKGNFNWTFKFDQRYGPGRLLVDNDGTIYVGSGNLSGYIGPYNESFFYAISAEGTLNWKVKIDGDASNSRISFDENHNISLRTGSMDDTWANIISTSGTVLSSEKVDNFFFYTDDAKNEYIEDFDKNRVIAKDSNGRILWTYEPALEEYEDFNIIEVTSDGTVYLRQGSTLLSISKGNVNWLLEDMGYSNLEFHSTGLYLVNAEWNWETEEEKTTILKINTLDGTVIDSKIANIYLYRGYFFDSQGTFYYPSGSNILTLDFDGTAEQGWVKVNGKWYFYDENGMMATSWVNYKGQWYFLNDSGAMETGWVKDAGKWYFLDNSGAMKTGWLKDGSKWYLLSSSGAMETGWVKDAGKWYYLDNSGAMQTGWVKDGGKWYFLNSNGSMKTGWLSEGSTWYYLNSGGSMQVGWKVVGNEWYYFYSSGKMAANTTVDGYKLGKDGAWIQ